MLFPRLTSQPHQFLWVQCEISQNWIRALHPQNHLSTHLTLLSVPGFSYPGHMAVTFQPNITENMETPKASCQQRFYPHQTNKARSPLTRVGQRRPSGEPGLSTHCKHKALPAYHTPYSGSGDHVGSLDFRLDMQ